MADASVVSGKVRKDRKVVDVKHMTRVLAPSTTGVSDSVASVEEEVRALLGEGWELRDVQVLAHSPNTLTVFYFFVKYATE